jgi:phosphotriesterase-related protein
MNKDELPGKVQTVLGLISPEDLGLTLPHEHILVYVKSWFKEPTASSDKLLAHQPLSLENIGWVRYHYSSNLDDLGLVDEQLAVREALRYKYSGGESIVDMTSVGMGRDPLALARISRATGLNIIMGTGYYVEQAENLTEEIMTAEIIRDVIIGVGNTGIRSGIIGEVGIDAWPMRDWERVSLRATAQAQKQTGAAVNIHPGRSPESPFEIIEVLETEGADINRVAISHIERTIFDHDTRVKLAKTGCYLEYDLFSLESWYHPRSVISETNPIKGDLPNDAGRINAIMALIDDGFLNQILISHDIAKKHRLHRYGGLGYDHIIQNVVPSMREKGMSEKHINTILVDNPKRLLQFV